MLSDPVLFGIMGAGLALGVVCFFRSSATRVQTAAAAAAVTKLCGAGDFDRARKLCAVAPEVPYLAAVAHALAVVATPGLRHDRGHLRARLQEAFRGEVARRVARLKRGLAWDVVALSLLGLALGLALSRPSPFLPVAVTSGAAILVLFSTVRRKLGVGTSCRLAESATLEAILAGAVESQPSPAAHPVAAPPAHAAPAPAAEPSPPAPVALEPSPLSSAPSSSADPFAPQGPLPPLGSSGGGRPPA